MSQTAPCEPISSPDGSDARARYGAGVRIVQLIAPVMALAGIAGCSTESTEDVVTRTRAEVWVDDRGGDVDALVDLCAVDATATEAFDELVDNVTSDVLAAMQFTCPVLGDLVALEVEQ